MVHFYYPPTHASWWDQIECRVSILSHGMLKAASFTPAKQVSKAIDRLLDAYNEKAAPFDWQKRNVHFVPFKRYIVGFHK